MGEPVSHAEVEVHANADTAASAAAQRIAAELLAARAARGAAHFALAGGHTPARCYELVGPMLGSWAGTELWLGDERVVPAGDPARNEAMVRSVLLPLTPGARFHPVPAGLPPAATAEAYERELAAALPAGADGGPPVLDVALLGLGEDGHTASLFPFSRALAIEDRLCIAISGAPKPPPDRVSMTLPLLGAARSLIVLAVGEGKAMAVARALDHPDTGIPASLLPHATTRFIIDRAAARRLGRE